MAGADGEGGAEKKRRRRRAGGRQRDLTAIFPIVQGLHCKT
jgi:hypothetical protein